MAKHVAVIGLGYFGSQLATTLASQGAEVLALDKDAQAIDEIKDRVTSAVRLDATDEAALRSHALEKFDAVVVGIGDDFEEALLTVTSLQAIGVKRLIVRGTTPVHERILNHLGVREVILPAVEAADRLANSLLYESVLDSFSLSSEYTIVEVPAPERFLGKPLKDLSLPATSGVSVITIKRMVNRPGPLGIGTRRAEAILGLPTHETVVERGDVLVLFGAKTAIERMLNA